MPYALSNTITDTDLTLTLTLTENPKLHLSPGLVASYDIQPGNGVGLLW